MSLLVVFGHVVIQHTQAHQIAICHCLEEQRWEIKTAVTNAHEKLLRELEEVIGVFQTLPSSYRMVQPHMSEGDVVVLTNLWSTMVPPIEDALDDVSDL